MSRLGIGLLGAGRIGALHAEVIAAHPRCRLVAVHDARAEAAAVLADRHGARVAADAASILGDKAVQAVVIATRTDSHAALIADAARAGKAMLCEKPLDLEPGPVAACAAMLRATPHRLRLGFNRRFDPGFLELRGAIAAATGGVETLHVITRVPSPPPYRYVDESGGLFRDMTIHDLDLARFLLDAEEVVAVSASGGAVIDPALVERGDIDTAMVTLCLAGGGLVHIANSRRCAYGFDHRVEAFGPRGAVGLQNGAQGRLRRSGAEGTGIGPLHRDSPIFGYRNSFHAQWAAFVAWLEGGKAAGAGFDDGWHALALALAARQSLAEGRAVDPRPLIASIALPAEPRA